MFFIKAYIPCKVILHKSNPMPYHNTCNFVQNIAHLCQSSLFPCLLLHWYKKSGQACAHPPHTDPHSTLLSTSHPITHIRIIIQWGKNKTMKPIKSLHKDIRGMIILSLSTLIVFLSISMTSGAMRVLRGATTESLL